LTHCETLQNEHIEADRLVFRTLAGFNMTVSEGNMKAFQIDGGNPIVPSAAVDSIGVLYPGERVDIVVSGEQIKHVTIALDKEYALSLLCRKLTHGVTGIS
jgi:hypothetical protein